MRSLVMYDSSDATSEVIARAIAEGLSERGSSRAVAIASVAEGDIGQASLVVIGGPAGLGGAARPILSFLRSPYRRAVWRNRPVAVFETAPREGRSATGPAGQVLVHRLLELGATILVPPQRFREADVGQELQAEEVGRAVLWGRSLHLADRVMAEGE